MNRSSRRYKIVMANLMWPEVGDEYRGVFSELERIALELGHTMDTLRTDPDTDWAQWLDPDAYIVRNGLYVKQEPLRRRFREAVLSGRRLLVMTTTDLNEWIEPTFGLVVGSDRHFDIARWSDRSWQGDSGKDQLVAWPASGRVAIDILLDGVEHVVMDQPRVVRAFDQAQPLLQVQHLDVVTKSDLPQRASIRSEADSCVAAFCCREGTLDPHVVVLGAGAPLTDSDIARGHNRRLAENLVAWLAGGAGRLQAARRAKELLDAVELDLRDLVVGLLRERLADSWADGLSERSREKALRREELDVREALDLSDLVNTTFHDPFLVSELGIIGGRSKRASERLWGKVVRRRNLIAHPVRLQGLDELEAKDLLSALEELSSHLGAARRRWQAGLCNDPRKL